MKYLLDTSILIRLSDSEDEFFVETVNEIDRLKSLGETLIVVPQCIYEYWSVATRPVERRGLGLTPEQTKSNIDLFRQDFIFAVDIPGLYREWLDIVTSLQVRGKESHDARLVAFMNLSKITEIVTFNTADFARYPTVTAVDPRAPRTSS